MFALLMSFYLRRLRVRAPELFDGARAAAEIDGALLDG